ncbi:aminotransferase class I/II-fold pyridoxal phosphate-dependent enzyme [Panacagrimonas sp.]|uniref:aminotransferase class I/II-fold pyridoxal phosphate-dependent enzyme n=1 Tax=Panacagrimonas sp. TaxID=2480088 RepID=UPI003B5174CC
MADDTRPPLDASSARTLDARLSRRLSELRDADLYRVRRVIGGTHGVRLEVDGHECLNFCSNDYLGLASDPRVSRAAQRALQECGTGSGASALISGYNREHRLLEEALAEFTGYPRVLLFTSGWAANCGVLRGLLGRDDVLIADELNHASLIDGGRLSGARYVRVSHADVDGFAAALDDSRFPVADSRLRVVVTDSVFSMDGDLAPLPGLSALCTQHGAALMTDDAHGFGVLGAQGRGANELLGTRPDIYVATMGKSLGAAGAFVAGSEALIEYLIQRARSFVFSTAPPPAIAAAAREALRIISDEPALRAQLHANIARFTEGAAQLGIRLGPPAVEHAGLTPIQPLLIGDSAQTMKASRALFERGYWVAGIRPPTVAAGTARLRITLSAGHQPAHIDGLLDAMRACGLGRS